MTAISVEPMQDRDQRQRDLVPPERLANCRALVIGVGAISRQVALQLAALGMPELLLFDHDHVAHENLAPQGYRPDQLGMAKVNATALDCQKINPATHIMPRAERFRRSLAMQITAGQTSLVVFCCVDSIGTRRMIWEAISHSAALFLDARMSGEVIRVLAADSPATNTHYPTTLFAANQAYVGACTARSTIYTASIAAGLLVCQATRWLRQLPTDPDITFNLLSMELTALTPPLI